jgi:hypothetical protein
MSSMNDKSFISRTQESERDKIGLGKRGWITLFCLVCLVVIFNDLGATALFEPDEGRNAEKAREILLLGDWVKPYENFLTTLDKPLIAPEDQMAFYGTYLEGIPFYCASIDLSGSWKRGGEPTRGLIPMLPCAEGYPLPNTGKSCLPMTSLPNSGSEMKRC